MKTILFFNVDTQKDFMNKDGALYVPGAETIKENLKKLTGCAIKNNIRVITSMDKHFGGDGELIRNGGPFPDHCMNGTKGQQQIDETKVKGQTIIEKQNYDVFSNPATKKSLEGVKEATLYGVATEYCVKAAVLGMLKMEIKVNVVEDAIKGVAEDTTKKAIEEMKNNGATFKKTEDILNEKEN